MKSEKQDAAARICLCNFHVLLFVAPLFLIGVAHAQTFNVLYSFQYPGPVEPASGVTIDAAGNLYGTTSATYAGEGGIFKLSNRNNAWTFSLLFSFTGTNGDTPLAPPVFGPDGSLYGTTYEGGFGCDLGCGNVYNLRPPLSPCKTALCYWTASTVWDFDSIPNDGVWPVFGNLLFDASGNIYGTTSFNVPGSGVMAGTVFELTRANGVWNETILHQFGNGTDGSVPESGLLRDSNGNLYGTTAEGGTNTSCNSGRGCGTIYELSPSGSGWTEQVLYSFQAQNDGDTPVGGLIMDAAGNLYGTTSQDGVNGGGTIFELTPSNGNWTLTTLYGFPKTGEPGYFCWGQQGDLLLDSAGNLYGTTCTNGAYGYGAVFKLTNANGSWSYSSLHDFTNGNDGASPIGNPVFDRNGNIFGTAFKGGANLEGTVWEVTP